MQTYWRLFILLTLFGSSTLILKGQIINGQTPFDSFAPDGIPFVVADSAFMPDMKGNHRAVVKVVNSALKSVVVDIPWRRPDLRPETKKVVVYGAKSGKEILNVHVLEFSSEKGRIAFQPNPGETNYYVYYLPYKFRRLWDDARYGKPWNDYLAPVYSSDPSWVLSVKRDQLTFHKATVERIESRSKFDAFTSIGLIATKHEIATVLAKQKDNFLIYTENRAFPIRLPQTIPARWANRIPNSAFVGDASKNEYYTWQIGLWAVRSEVKNIRLSFTDFIGTHGRISKDSVTCFNQQGINWDGYPINFAVNVAKGSVQALWCGIQIPQNAIPGEYIATATLTADGALPRKIKIAIRVNDQILADKGDSEVWRYSRLRWLNSKIGIDDSPVKPYNQMTISGDTIVGSGKTLVINKNGLPASIYLNDRQVLAKPISFEVVTNKGTIVYHGENLKINQVSSGKITWTTSAVQEGLELSCDAIMEFDGCIKYNLQLSAKLKDISVRDVRLNTVYSAESSQYFMGAGFAGGLRPESHTWDWKGPYDSYWIGSDLSGLHVEFIGDVYHGPLIADYKPGAPKNWANNCKGQITETGEKGKETVLIVSTGPFTVTKVPVKYGLEFLITPVRPTNSPKHFSERYFHANPKDFSKAAKEGGANIANIHHAGLLNPFINYPFIVRDSLIKFIGEQHLANRKVKLYYTVRELTTHCAEVYALMSLKKQIFEPGPGYGLPWECEHLIDNYKPAWYTELPDQISDAALVLVGSSRWINYYLEGLRWMLENYKIDGIYMDDVSFDRPVMKRIRRIMEKYRPEALIDLHSNTAYSIGPANQYTGFFPYVDRLWFGESFQYNKMTPDEWLVTASGIPFGQMAEMLQGGGNRYLGMVYGETARDSYGEFSPRPVWNLWKTFGITDAKMIGYWDKDSPVHTNHPNVKATVFVKAREVLISIGNFDENDQNVTLSFDWKALGMNPENSVIEAPAIQDFQDAKTFNLNESIPVQSKKGWLLILHTKS